MDDKHKKSIKLYAYADVIIGSIFALLFLYVLYYGVVSFLHRKYTIEISICAFITIIGVLGIYEGIRMVSRAAKFLINQDKLA